MKIEFVNKINNVYCAFTDEGVLVNTDSGGVFFPYGNIKKIGLSIGSLTISGSLKGKDRGSIFVYNSEDKPLLLAAISYAKQQMKEMPFQDMCEISALSYSEETRLFKSMQLVRDEIPTIDHEDYLSQSTTRVAWRNTGLVIWLFSALLVFFACFAGGGDGAAFLGVAGAIGIAVGLIMWGSHFDPTTIRVRDSKNKSETKEIVKGAVIGGIVAGEAGAVVGATIAKNKLDQNKK